MPPEQQGRHDDKEQNRSPKLRQDLEPPAKERTDFVHELIEQDGSKQKHSNAQEHKTVLDIAQHFFHVDPLSSKKINEPPFSIISPIEKIYK